MGYPFPFFAYVLLWGPKPYDRQLFPVVKTGWAEQHSASQRLQNPLTKEYTLNHIRDPIMI